MDVFCWSRKQGWPMWALHSPTLTWPSSCGTLSFNRQTNKIGGFDICTWFGQREGGVVCLFRFPENYLKSPDQDSSQPLKKDEKSSSSAAYNTSPNLIFVTGTNWKCCRCQKMTKTLCLRRFFYNLQNIIDVNNIFLNIIDMNNQFWKYHFFLKCLIQLDKRIQYQNANARILAHFLNSPQQGEAPSAWTSTSTRLCSKIIVSLNVQHWWCGVKTPSQLGHFASFTSIWFEKLPLIWIINISLRSYMMYSSNAGWNFTWKLRIFYDFCRFWRFSSELWNIFDRPKLHLNFS